jgi:hypothetical protein
MNKLNKNFSVVVNHGSYRDYYHAGDDQTTLLQLGYYIIKMRTEGLRDIAILERLFS